jgi:hypothetical protein
MLAISEGLRRGGGDIRVTSLLPGVSESAIRPVMVRWLGILFGALRSGLGTHRELALENLALGQQLAVWKSREPRAAVAGVANRFEESREDVIAMDFFTVSAATL